MSNLLYTLIGTSGSVITICEHNNQNLEKLAYEIASKIDLAVDHNKFLQDDANFNALYTVEDTICFLCIIKKNYPYRLALEFLTQIRKDYNIEMQYIFNTEKYKGNVKKTMKYYDDTYLDSIRDKIRKVEEIKDIMHDNVTKLLERGNKIEHIEDKAVQLEIKTEAFNQKSKDLKCCIYLQNCKLWIILISLILCIIFTIIVIIVIVIIIIVLHYKK